jgi:hypothetical protein
MNFLDRGLADYRTWPEEFTAGAIFINLPSDILAPVVNARILELISTRLPESLLGAITNLEPRRALSRPVRRRSLGRY